MGIMIRDGEKPAKKVGRGKNAEVYDAASRLKPGQWFVWDDGKVKCLPSYRTSLKRLKIASVEVYADSEDRVVFAHAEAPTGEPDETPTPSRAPASPAVLPAPPVKRGPGRPPGSGLKPPKVDPRVAALGRR